MKSRFSYLYIAFIVSLALVVILSFLFYKRLNSHLKFSHEDTQSFEILLYIKKLEEKMLELENYSTAFLLVRDSTYLPAYRDSRDSAMSYVERLQQNLAEDTDQMRHFLLMKSTVNTQMNIYNRNIERVGFANSEEDIRLGISRARMLMDAFRTEARQIEKTELTQREDLLATKEFFEDIYPGYFNTISIWAGIVTLVSFYFINREVRTRKRYQLELEKKLHELNVSNSELKQFAYIASHDLQEPLRKIRTFSDKLKYKYDHSIDDGTRQIVNKIESSAQRMQELIHDMLNFTGLISRNTETTTVDLNTVITGVLTDYMEQSRERHAVITWDMLPQIQGNEEQLRLLFRSLIDNAFKFSKEGEPPEIRITYRLVNGSGEGDEHLKGRTYHRIVMEDKGIGFSNEFAEKIFMIFQRLHNQQSDYRGKGIGLALAQRVMSNHSGVIMARGMVNDGATFMMYFPTGE